MKCSIIQPRTNKSEAATVPAGKVLPFPIQAKLTIGSPNDHYEQQADQVADQVMRMPLTSSFGGGKEGTVQRKCATCEHADEKIQRKPFNITPFIQKSGADGGGVATDAVSSQIESARGGGNPMGESTKSFMESRFGNDFSGVRIHTDANAIQLSQNLNAQAFTVGNDVFFNQGKYNPESDSGKHLLAHELTHTVQQSGVVQRKLIQRTLIIDPRASVPARSATGRAVPLTTAVQGLLNQVCAAGRFTINTTTGAVTSKQAFCQWHPPLIRGVTEADISSTPAGCNCLCDVVNHARTTTVSFSAGGPGAAPRSTTGAVGSGGAGHDGNQTDSNVGIDPRFQGQYKINGAWVDVPFFLLFSHELCGHALPKMRGTHIHRGAAPAGGTPPEEVHSVATERVIAGEHGLPLRPDDYGGAARQRP